MPRRLLAVAVPFVVAPIVAAVQPALAQGQRCAPRAQVVELLATRHAETRRAIGLTANQTVMELYASEATGSWTLLVTLPNGLACLVAAGNGFEQTGAGAAGAPA